MIGKKGLTESAFAAKEKQIRTAMAVFRDGIVFDPVSKKQISLSDKTEVDAGIGTMESMYTVSLNAVGADGYAYSLSFGF